MFATLVIVLPSEYSGGELLIRHKNQEARLDLCPSDPSEATFAAFYADCRHEVLPVTAGHRLTLVYNLLRTSGGPLPQAPDYDEQRTQAAARLRTWSQSAHASDSGPDKLVYPLEHAYTQAELGFDTIKGTDAAVASLATSAAEEASCDLHLALLTIEESGWAEYAGGGWDEDEADYEIGEVDDSSETLHDWRRPDGSASNMGSLTFFDDEVCPSNALDDAEDAEPDFAEATGNAGASFERFYQRAALILWPRSKRADVVAQGGLPVSLPLLAELVEQWEADGGKPDTDNWTRAAEVACGCAQCADLNRFLRSPDEPQWRLKAVENKRRHAEDSIARYRCDLDLATDKRGRPYTLVCTKNQASYERLARQRRQDLEHRSLLGG